MDLFYGYGTVYFLPLSSQKFLVLILRTSKGWKAESTLNVPNVLKGHNCKVSSYFIFNTRVLLHSRPNLEFDLTFFSFFFFVYFVHSELLFFILHDAFSFLSENEYVNQTYTIILAFLVSEMGLTTL